MSLKHRKALTAVSFTVISVLLMVTLMVTVDISLVQISSASSLSLLPIVAGSSGVCAVAGAVAKDRPSYTIAYELEGREIFICIATYPADGENADDLFKNADKAMYHAKGKRKNNYQYYSPAMNVSSLDLLNMENNLHQALERKELKLYYQPKLDLKTRTICGMAALIRWQRPVEGLIQPDKFIPLAEACGLIVPIGEFVLKEAC